MLQVMCRNNILGMLKQKISSRYLLLTFGFLILGSFLVFGTFFDVPLSAAIENGESVNQGGVQWTSNIGGVSAMPACAVACVPVYTTVPGSQACTVPNSTGLETRTGTTDSCTGSTTWGAWDTSGCVCNAGYVKSGSVCVLVACVPTFTPTSGTTTCSSLIAGTTGTATRTGTTNSCTGVTTWGAWDTTACVPACTPGTYGSWAINCTTETKTRYDVCTGVPQTIDLSSAEKNACRDFNWREVAP